MTPEPLLAGIGMVGVGPRDLAVAEGIAKEETTSACVQNETRVERWPSIDTSDPSNSWFGVFDQVGMGEGINKKKRESKKKERRKCR